MPNVPPYAVIVECHLLSPNKGCVTQHVKWNITGYVQWHANWNVAGNATSKVAKMNYENWKLTM